MKQGLRYVKRVYRFSFAMLLCWFPLSSFSSVRAIVENTKVEEGQPIQLIVETDQMAGEPELEPLQQSFEIIGAGHTMQTQEVNGKASHRNQYIFALLPKKTVGGKGVLVLTIPALHWGAESSESVEIEVYATQEKNNLATEAPVFVSAELGMETAVLGQAIPYTFKLYITPELARHLSQMSLREPEKQDFIWKPMGQAEQKEERRNGQLYQVLEQSFLIFTQRSGAIEIPGVIFSAVLQDDLGAWFDLRDPQFASRLLSGGRILHLEAPVKTLTIEPLSESGLVPLSDVSIQDSWDLANTEFKVGEPLTRTVTLKAKGVRAQDLPELVALPMEHVNLYPTLPQLHEKIEGQAILAERQQKIAYLFTEAGEYQVPEQSFRFWNTSTRQIDQVILLGRVIKIAAKEPTPSVEKTDSLLPVAAHSSTATSSSGVWPSIAAGLAVLWMLTIAIAWIMLGRKRLKPTSLKSVGKKSLQYRWQQALHAKDLSAMEACLLEWSGVILGHPVRSLGALKQEVVDEKLCDQLDQLAQALYGGVPVNIDFESWCSVLKQTKVFRKKQRKNSEKLPSLY